MNASIASKPFLSLVSLLLSGTTGGAGDVDCAGDGDGAGDDDCAGDGDGAVVGVVRGEEDDGANGGAGV